MWSNLGQEQQKCIITQDRHTPPSPAPRYRCGRRPSTTHGLTLALAVTGCYATRPVHQKPQTISAQARTLDWCIPETTDMQPEEQRPAMNKAVFSTTWTGGPWPRPTAPAWRIGPNLASLKWRENQTEPFVHAPTANRWGFFKIIFPDWLRHLVCGLYAEGQANYF